jgi:two-component system aerobic respiration control sensor histidine kinase ArcB
MNFLSHSNNQGGAEDSSAQDPNTNCSCEFLFIPQPSVLLSQQGEVLDCNDAFLELFGLQRKDLIHNYFFKVCSEHNIVPPVTNLEDITSPFEVKTIIPKASDDKFLQTIQWSVSPIRSGPYKDCIFLLGFNITDFISSSAKEANIIKSIIDQLPNHFIFWKDKNSVYLGCNQLLASAVGLQSSAEIVGKTDYDLPTSKDQSDAYRADDKLVMESGIPKLNIEETQTLTDGNTRILSTNKTPLIDEHGNVYGVLAIYSDITERKNLERSLENAKNMAEAASRAKSEFIANMSHDLRTPLNGIVGMSELLQGDVDKQQQKQYAEWVNESGEQLLGLLNGILDVVSADNIKENDIQEETFELAQCLQDLVRLEIPSAELKGLSLKTNIPQNVPQYLHTDRTKLHRTLLNLLGNAIKFTEHGQITIEVELLNTSADRAQLQFRVVDTGIGIPDQLQDKVFDRFYRVNPSHKGVYSGHGIGLHIAQSYVKLLGGEIKVRSQESIGTTFYFDLNLKIGNKNDIKPLLSKTGISQKMVTSETGKLIPITQALLPNAPAVLLVEDNGIALKMVEVLATHLGCNYTSVKDGEKALRLAKSTHFDLIITDIGLPGISGHRLTHLIREWEYSTRKPPTPIIGLSAHVNEEIKEECYLSGMNEVLTKPINLKRFQSLLTQFVEPGGNERGIVSTPSSTQPSTLGFDLTDTEEELFQLEKYPLLEVETAINNIGDEELLRQMLEILLHQEIPNDLIALENAHLAEDWDTIEKIAHKIKGGAVYVGTTRMKYACQYLERYHKAGYSNVLEPLYQQLITVVSHTAPQIERWLK